MYISDSLAQIKGESPLIKDGGYLLEATLDQLGADLVGKHFKREPHIQFRAFEEGFTLSLHDVPHSSPVHAPHLERHHTTRSDGLLLDLDGCSQFLRES